MWGLLEESRSSCPLSLPAAAWLGAPRLCSACPFSLRCGVAKSLGQAEQTGGFTFSVRPVYLLGQQGGKQDSTRVEHCA